MHAARVEQAQYEAPGHIRRTRLECPLCKSIMRLKRDAVKNQLFYACPRYPACECTHGAHPNGDPMGRPGTADERRARKEAHAWFDQLWKGQRPRARSRREAYGWMHAMGLPRHISEMTVAQCEELVRLVKARLAAQGKL